MQYVAPFAQSNPDAHYVNGNPAAGIQGSIPPAAAFEHPMREIMAAIVGGGLEPDPEDLTQLLQAMRKISGPFASLDQVKAGVESTIKVAPDTVAKAVQAGSWRYAVAGGSANALTVTLTPAAPELVNGMSIFVKATNSNSGATTLSVNDLPAKAIVHKDGGALVAGDITSGQIISVIYDGSAFQLQAAAGSSQFVIPYTVDTGVANAIIADFAPAITALTSGMILQVKVAAANTGAATINVNGLGAKAIKTSSGANLSAGTLSAGQIVMLTYDGTNFQLGALLAGVGTSIPYVVDTGGAPNTVVAAFAPAVTAYTAGLAVLVKITNTNNGPATLNCNSLGAVPVTRQDGTPVKAGDLIAGQVALFVHNGAAFELIGVESKSIQSGATNFAIDTGTANAVLVDLAPAPNAYAAGLVLRVKVAAQNTGPSTINVNGLGAKNICYPDGSDLNRGALIAGMIAILVYDGGAFHLINPGSSASLAANGYQKLPSGLILQWATGANQTVGGNADPHQTITFPIAFPTAVAAVIVSTNNVSNNDNGDHWYQVYSKTLTNCVLSCAWPGNASAQSAIYNATILAIGW